MGQRFGSIDIGSNSVLCLDLEWLGKPDGVDRFRLWSDRSEVTRLSHGLAATGEISQAAIDRTAEVLRQFRSQSGPDQWLAVTTEAVRQARNRDSVLSQLSEAMQTPIRLISGPEEATYSFVSIAAERTTPFTPLVFDVGGASTELVWAVKDNPPQALSLPIGSVTLWERFAKGDPPDSDTMHELRATIDEALSQAPIPTSLRNMALDVVGVAGTMATLATISLEIERYARQRVDGLQLPRDRVESWADRLASLTVDERKALPGMHPKRADVIPSGSAIVARILRFFNAAHVTFLDRGVRYGVVYDQLNLLADYPHTFPRVSVESPPPDAGSVR